VLAGPCGRFDDVRSHWRYPAGRRRRAATDTARANDGDPWPFGPEQRLHWLISVHRRPFRRYGRRGRPTGRRVPLL